MNISAARHALIALALGLLVAPPARGAERLLYNRDIRPLLSDKCFFCHGPDAQKREAKLRLDVRESATAAGAIVPGKPEQSKLIARITTTDPDDHMPPAKAKLRSFTPAEVALLRQWIAEGAEYQAHWAFVAPMPNPVPAMTMEVATTGSAPATKPSAIPAPTAIDAFVWRELQRRGLRPQPEADRATLLRRVSFDLTGLPPTPEEIEAFARDTAPQAYERVVDRLLQSERYGERMAVDWLDVARYADSYGFQVDREREMWPWRDWVVRAFNQNLPFNQFITAQIAGDLLPNPTDEQILATAFSRLHQQETEGGSVEEEYRVEYVADRVQTFATAFLGLTFECARCHDHKFDPVTQKEYYGLFSFFQNIDEAGLYSYFTPSVPTPAHMMLEGAAKEKLAAVREKITAAERHGRELRAAGGATFAAWLKARPAELKLPGELARYTFDTLEKGNKCTNALGGALAATLAGENKLVPGRLGNAVQFSGDDPVNLALGNFQRHEPFSVALWLRTPDVKDRAVIFHRSQAWTDAGSRGYELLLEDGRLKWSLIHFWPGNAISIQARATVPTNTWTHVVVTYDGSSRADGLRLFVNGSAAAVDVVRDNLTKNITGGGHDNISLAERMRDRGFKGGAIDEFRVFGRVLTPLEAFAAHDDAAARTLLAKSEATLTAAERALLQDYFLATEDTEFQKQLTVLKTVRAELSQLADGVKEIMVMRELPQPKKAYVLFRGEYNQRRDEVPAVTPAALSAWPAGAPRNRLGLAQWLTAPEHTLTARVTVNRFWQNIFGRGLVKTAEDFGSQGARPLYPEVLDWLALKFVASGWDTKALLKAIVTTHTYRQRSVADATTMADDPDNELLARGPRFRLPAEMIRDNALAAAGLLKNQLGGPPVNPYEMSESFKPANASGGDGALRRSLYTNWRRTGPPPALLAFDAPRRAVCSARRERTDSPLQALILLNGVQYVEAARALGETLHHEAKGDVTMMIERGFSRCLSRKPDARETTILRKLYTAQLKHFQAAPAEAAQLLKIGNTKRDEKIPAPEAAAATVLAQALLNHDGCVVKR